MKNCIVPDILKTEIAEILTDEKTSLDLKWIKDDSDTVDCTLAELMQEIEAKSANIANAVAELAKLTADIAEE